jgi:hypothetical protein
LDTLTSGRLVIAYVLPVNGGHPAFASHSDAGESIHSSLIVLIDGDNVDEDNVAVGFLLQATIQVQAANVSGITSAILIAG